MYPNYSKDRKALGSKALIDTTCGKQLVLIIDLTVLSVKLLIIIVFSVAESAQAMGTNHLPQQIVANITDRNVSRLIKPSINLDIEPKIIMLSSARIRTKSDLRNSKWRKKFLLTVRKGDNEKLIKSIFSKVSEVDRDIPSINKILKKLAEVTFKIGTN